MSRVQQTKEKAKKKKSYFIDTMSEMLTISLRQRKDFIITFEPVDNGKPNCQIHVMTGRLINPCMLNTLKHRVSLYSDEGAKVMTRRWF